MIAQIECQREFGMELPIGKDSSVVDSVVGEESIVTLHYWSRFLTCQFSYISQSYLLPLICSQNLIASVMI
jgi:hypothetical protein